MKKRLFLLITAAVVMLSLYPMASASYTPVKELPYAYIDTSASYLTIGEPFTFTVILPEDPAPYQFKYTFYHHLDVTANEDFAPIDYTEEIKGQNEFTVTPLSTGKYFLQVEVSDDSYRYIKLVSQPLFGYDAADKEDPSTLPGRVAALTEEVAAQNFSSDYDKALWLNDWLIYNADYDESLEEHHPQGVLLRGTGVCESYALAYQILLQESDIDSIYLNGYSRGELHTWNLVLLEGGWTYVDTTWNDPMGGGKETRDYFGMHDDLFARDHDMDQLNFIPPAADSNSDNYNLRNGYLPFDSAEGLDELLGSAMEARQESILYTYQGSDRFFDLNYEVERWLNKNSHRYFTDTWTFGGSSYSGHLDLSYTSDEGFITFSSEEGLAQLLEEQLANKPAQLKIYYNGPDSYYMIRSPLDNWMSNNGANFGVSSYRYNYSDFWAEITLSY